MLFSSISYLYIFLPITLFLFYLSYALKEKKNILNKVPDPQWVLIISSLVFYGMFKAKYVLLLLTSIIFNYFFSPLVKRNKFMLVFGIILNALPLIYFKYINFIFSNINVLAGRELFHHLDVYLPLAVSFFTFQQIAYLVDSYKGLTKKENNFKDYVSFITFFPHLIAGPILHWSEMMPQFKNIKIPSNKALISSCVLFCIGLFKKVIIADNFAILVDQLHTANGDFPLLKAWAASLGYSIQLYFDFSGYCDMGLGTAGLFSITLPLNFNSPYKALNIQEFWKRWHITLSRWLREYIYIPLGGNREGFSRELLNLFLTFLFGGIWHGAGWTFIVWGCMHAFALIFHRLWRFSHIEIYRPLSWFLTFNFVNIAWIYFRSADLTIANKIVLGLIKFDTFSVDQSNIVYIFYIGLCLAVLAFCAVTPNSQKIAEKASEKYDYGILAYMAGFVLLMSTAFIMASEYSPFLYFNF